MYRSGSMKKTISLLALAAIAISASFSIGQDEQKDSIKVSEFTFKFAKPWIRQQVSSPMRAGQFTYDHEDEELKDVDLILYYFGQGQGGGIQANIDRWVGQFEGTPDSKQEVKKHGDREVTYLVAKGTYLDGPPFGGNKTPRPDYTMLAAILPSEQGAVFLKLTGPSKSVEAMQEAFDAFAASAFEE